MTAFPMKDKQGASEAVKTTRNIRARSPDTIIVPANEEGFKKVFLGEQQWHAIKIGAHNRARIRFIAAYQTAPISAVTHIAEVKDFRPFLDTNKYVAVFKSPARSIRPIPLGEHCRYRMQSPVCVVRDHLLAAASLEKLLGSNPNPRKNYWA